MATPPQIDVAALLLPIPPDQRLGSDSDREAVHSAFRGALQGGDVSSGRSGPGEGRSADLDRLIEQGSAYLARKAKDLVIAAWMTEVLTEKSGLAGLRDGLALIHGLLAGCWDDCYPPLDRDGDADLRARPLESLASERSPLLLRLRRISLADSQSGAAPFCYPDVRRGTTALMEEQIASGPIGDAVALSTRAFYERLADDLLRAREAGRALVREVKDRFRDNPPRLSGLDRVLAECQEVVEVILAVKRRQDPKPDSNGPAPVHRTPAAGPLEVAPASPPPGVPGPSRDALDYGRVLIEFSERARTLAEETGRLKANREEYEGLKEKMKELDAEYEAITARIACDRDFEPLLKQRLALPEAGPPGV